MNARRVAEILRERAKLDIELAEAFEEGDAETAPEAKPRVPRRPRARSFPAPLREPSELDRAAARKTRNLRDRGIGR